MKSRGIKLALIGLVAVPGACAVVIMLLWNWLMPAIFALTTITFWQALGLFVLSRILFGRLGFGRNGMMMRGRENHFREKWMKMTPEQRKEFIDKRRKFGFGRPFGMERFDMEEHEEQTGQDK